MTFQWISPSKIKIQLSPQDLKNMDISFQTLSCESRQTKSFLLLLLAQAKSLAGFDATGGRLLVEVYEEEAAQGALAVYFTIVSKTPKRLKSKPLRSPCEAMVCAFDTLDNVIDACVKLFPICCHRIYKSALYQYQSNYYLVVYKLCADDTFIHAFLNEYGAFPANQAALLPFLEEHARVVIGQNAIDKLAYYLS